MLLFQNLLELRVFQVGHTSPAAGSDAVVSTIVVNDNDAIYSFSWSDVHMCFMLLTASFRANHIALMAQDLSTVFQCS